MIVYATLTNPNSYIIGQFENLVECIFKNVLPPRRPGGFSMQRRAFSTERCSMQKSAFSVQNRFPVSHAFLH